jgi:hypothetical protein
MSSTDAASDVLSSRARGQARMLDSLANKGLCYKGRWLQRYERGRGKPMLP